MRLSEPCADEREGEALIKNLIGGKPSSIRPVTTAEGDLLHRDHRPLPEGSWQAFWRRLMSGETGAHLRRRLRGFVALIHPKGGSK